MVSGQEGLASECYSVRDLGRWFKKTMLPFTARGDAYSKILLSKNQLTNALASFSKSQNQTSKIVKPPLLARCHRH